MSVHVAAPCARLLSTAYAERVVDAADANVLDGVPTDAARVVAQRIIAADTPRNVLAFVVAGIELTVRHVRTLAVADVLVCGDILHHARSGCAAAWTAVGVALPACVDAMSMRQILTAATVLADAPAVYALPVQLPTSFATASLNAS